MASAVMRLALVPAEPCSYSIAIFDCLVAPIEEKGGLILEFIGDAVLAYFPIVLGQPDRIQWAPSARYTSDSPR